MTKLSQFIFSCFLLTNSSYSQTASKKTPKKIKPKITVKKEKAQTPVKITSDHMRYNETKSFVYFTGNVLADDGTMKVNSDIMNVKLDAKSSPTLIICEKNVIIRKENSTSYSKRADYFLPKEEIILTGKPKVLRINPQGEKEMIKGKTITFYKNTGIIKVKDPIVEFPNSNKKKVKGEKDQKVTPKTQKATTAKVPIKINADDMHYNEAKGIVTFTGKVHVDDGAMKVDSDFMTITLDKSRSPTLIICEKNVVIIKDNSTSHSDRAEYFIPDEKIILTGKPKVVTINDQGKKETVQGSTITFYTNSNVIDVQRGTFEFPTQNSDKKKSKSKEKNK